jgi:hypothetical protein
MWELDGYTDNVVGRIIINTGEEMSAMNLTLIQA